MSTDPPLELQVKKWLNAQGYPLEFACADALRSAGTEVQQGLYLQSGDKTEREVDVAAEYYQNNQHHSIMSSSFVECKYSQKPWVALSQEQGSVHPDTMVSAFAGLDAPALHLLLELGDQTASLLPPHSIDILVLPTDHIAFAIVEALKGDSNNRDVPYAAISKIEDIAETHLAVRIGEVAGTSRRSYSLVFPCVVVKGTLFAAVYDSSSGELRTTQSRSVRVDRVGKLSVYVIDSAHFPEFAKEIADRMRRFVALVVDGLEAKRRPETE